MTNKMTTSLTQNILITSFPKRPTIQQVYAYYSHFLLFLIIPSIPSGNLYVILSALYLVDVSELISDEN